MDIRRVAAYAWALPWTTVGLLFVFAGLATGGRATLEGGVVEGYGGILAWFLRRAVPLRGGASAMTLGHVVIGRDAPCLERTRAHERVHVRQYERWGALFLPAYVAASIVAVASGRHYYRENVFERGAAGTAAPPGPGPSGPPQ